MTATSAAGRLLSSRRGWAMAVALMLAVPLSVGQAGAGVPDQPLTARASVDRSALPPAFDRPTPWRPAQVPAPPVPPAAPPPAAPVPVAAPADLCSGDGWQQRRGENALAGLRAGAERTGFDVAFAPARSGYLGLTHLQERRIEVFVRGCDVQSDALLRHVIAHELGHAYDTTHLTTEVRAAWQRVRGIPAATDWYGCSGCTDFATPAGDFAEVYAQWARGASDNRSELAGAPGPVELQALAAQFFGA